MDDPSTLSHDRLMPSATQRSSTVVALARMPCIFEPDVFRPVQREPFKDNPVTLLSVMDSPDASPFSISTSDTVPLICRPSASTLQKLDLLMVASLRTVLFITAPSRSTRSRSMPSTM